MAVDLHCIGGAVNRDPPAAALRQICLEQEAADALAVKRRVYEKQGDELPSAARTPIGRLPSQAPNTVKEFTCSAFAR